MSWRTVYIGNADNMKLYLDNLLVSCNGENVTIPLSDIFSIIVDKYDTAISSRLINKLTEYKINLVFCDLQHNPSSYLLGLNNNYNVAKILREQISWNDEIKGKMWQKIVKHKIKCQRELLVYLNKNERVINKLIEFENMVEFNQ